MSETADIFRKKVLELPLGEVCSLSEGVAQRSHDLVEELVERTRRHVRAADVPIDSGGASGNRTSKKHRPLQDKSLEELLEISAHLQEHAAALIEETRVLVERVQETRAVIRDRISREQTICLKAGRNRSRREKQRLIETIPRG